jgi:glutathione S-transferase
MSTSVTVIGGHLSPYVRKVLAVMYLKGIDYRTGPIVGFYADDRFAALNPLRTIRVLEEAVISPGVWGRRCDLVAIERVIREEIPGVLDYLETQLPQAGCRALRALPTSRSPASSATRRWHATTWTRRAGRVRQPASIACSRSGASRACNRSRQSC